MEHHMLVAWPGPARTAGSPAPSYETPLYTSYHLDQGKLQPTLLLQNPSQHAELVAEWTKAYASRGDSFFWGPIAFAMPTNPSERAVHWERLSSTVAAQHTTTNASSSDMHLSGAIGVGPSLGPLSVTVSGKYNRTVKERAHSCQDSFTLRIELGDLSLEQPLELTHEAASLLETEGPDIFTQIFGTHYTSALHLGADAGYCISLDDEDTTETHSLSVVAEVRFFFWTVKAELPLVQVSETFSNHRFSLVAYDTLDDTHVDVKSSAAEPLVFVEQGREIQSRILQLRKRLEAAARDCHPLMAIPQDRAAPILDVVVSPWATLRQWHEGVAKWKAMRKEKRS
ncbi:hypothetical protein EsH8_V_001156 [Colletotrichum jinshuiense]